MKKLIAIALLTASTAALANYQECSFYASLMYVVAEHKNKGTPVRVMFERADKLLGHAPELRNVFMADIATVYKMKGKVSPEAVENKTLLDCIEGG